MVEQAGIPCREAFYEFDENDLNGTHAAHAMGMPEEQVFKTLVARGERTGIHVFCIPVCCELDLKKAAKAAGDKNMEMVAVKELLGLTDHQRDVILSMNRRRKKGLQYREVFIALGDKKYGVYATEVSPQEAICYESNKEKKRPFLELSAKVGPIEAIRKLAGGE